MRMDILSLAISLCALVALAAGQSSAGVVRPRVTLPLSGQWQFLPAHDDEQIQDGDRYQWGTILVPALWGNAKGLGPEWTKEPGKEGNKKLHEQNHCWYRKRFRVDEGLRGMNCLLHIVDVRWSAEVWLNGVRLGEHVGAYRPVEFDATSAIRPGEDNLIYIRQGGGHTIPKYDDGVPKIPFGNKGWAQGASGIMGDVELRFFREVTISGIKIDPNIHNGSAQVTIRLTNQGKAPQKVSVEFAASERKSKRKASDDYSAFVVIERGETATVSDTVKIGKPRLWSPDDPFLYSLNVTAKAEGGAVCDHIDETFGMREFVCKGGDFYLNGTKIFLRGATDLAITGFPSWGTAAEILTDRKWIRKYLGADARGMNANVFRTHMGPWYKAYYDIADECGTMLISEFPNWPPEGGPNYYKRPGFADKLYSEMELIAESLWNHPSIIIWAACNEPYGDYSEHENKVLVPFFKKLDPTRPVMRAGAVSADIADQHNYEGFWTGTIGDHIHAATYLKDHNPDKPLCDTEYLETAVKGFGKPDNGRAQKWMGYNVTLERAEFTHALFTMEQTEVKRRLRFDGLLPFWYGMFMSKGETIAEKKWDTYYALKNSLAPVAVSIDLVDRHFAAGSELKLPVWTMNDLEKAKKGKVSVYLVNEDPPYIFAAPPAAPIAKNTLEVNIPPYSATPHDVTLPLPEQEGSYWLYATLEVKGRETVISKRPIHVLDRSVSIQPVKGAKVAIIEQGTALTDWAKSAGVEVRSADGPDCDVLIIGKDALGSEAVTQRMDKIKEWANSGGKLIILDQTSWPEGLFGVEITKKRDVSYLFKEKGQQNDPLWRGIADAYMENWNGSGAEGLTHFFSKKSEGETLAIGSSDQQGLNARALLRLRLGKGVVLACQIRIAERLAEGKMFDPVAERLMVNLIR
ncbi:MAG: glycoside hydrolase family 2 TIM barrel-domain containing protein [Armatimonadota bacterium]|nr:glycoside hydrolase family 2 TIM barrel-domain containing protein [Armatimonadota bacterium]